MYGNKNQQSFRPRGQQSSNLDSSNYAPIVCGAYAVVDVESIDWITSLAALVVATWRHHREHKDDYVVFLYSILPNKELGSLRNNLNKSNSDNVVIFQVHGTSVESENYARNLTEVLEQYARYKPVSFITGRTLNSTSYSMISRHAAIYTLMLLHNGPTNQPAVAFTRVEIPSTAQRKQERRERRNQADASISTGEKQEYDTYESDNSVRSQRASSSGATSPFEKLHIRTPHGIKQGVGIHADHRQPENSAPDSISRTRSGDLVRVRSHRSQPIQPDRSQEWREQQYDCLCDLFGDRLIERLWPRLRTKNTLNEMLAYIAEKTRKR